MRLEHRGVQISNGGSGGHHDHDGQGGFDRETEGDEARDPLVDAHAQAQKALAFELGSGEGERLRTRAGAQDYVAKTETRKLVEEGYGKRGSRRFTPRSCHRSKL